MKWLMKMNSALNDIEKNLSREIDLDIVCQKSLLASYNFQKIDLGPLKKWKYFEQLENSNVLKKNKMFLQPPFLLVLFNIYKIFLSIYGIIIA